MSVLDQIVTAKREEAAALRMRHTPSSFQASPLFHAPLRSLRGGLTAAPRPAIIAEIKRASPTAGMINATALPAELAANYRTHGASAISVLTDATFFSGCGEDLSAVRGRVDVPLLRKDFIVDDIQIPESRSLGADAILLIASILDAGQIRDFHGRASELGMECLVEIHHPEELEKIDFGTVRLIGINNRDLRDFTVDLGTTGRIAGLLPPDVTTVSESGLRSAADVRYVARAGIDAVLMGEYFMRKPDPGKSLEELLHVLREN
ncbi:MAG TPA: indole-3-glycerol phosphate synthase TrpC [Bacteroidota bacterium]|nr:indole-3-glycerol phosphate synthase TrpC [Bacteroidota bacterium]